MTFQPLIPTGGYPGWLFLQRTLDQQAQAHASAPAAQRDETYFRQTIGQIDSARDLVNDRRLLRVSLAAFGLVDDLPNRAFVERVLDSPTDQRGSFVNRLTDKRYLELAAAFGFADMTGPRHRDPAFADRILASFRERQFEAAVGQQDESMRLGLALERDLKRVAQGGQSEAAQWLRVIGTPSLRTVFETAYRLPSGFGALDIDRQIGILRDRTQRAFGDPGLEQFADPEKRDLLTRRFFVGEQIGQIQAISTQQTALTLLQSAQAGMARMRAG
ncbi:MAG: Protein of unknown function (DUF1217) [Rhodobacteraceae bacterium HLUCCA12]|nr:MAG: Protein of unknown function (DUF1217) [Rhodobacteraceae bacterium HLUCCA12]